MPRPRHGTGAADADCRSPSSPTNLKLDPPPTSSSIREAARREPGRTRVPGPPVLPFVPARRREAGIRDAGASRCRPLRVVRAAAMRRFRASGTLADPANDRQERPRSPHCDPLALPGRSCYHPALQHRWMRRATGHNAEPAKRDKPWIFRTYAGHSTAAESNALYRGNLAKGQTGLSVAFDLPTQTGYDPDHELARGEVGKVGVSDRPSRRHAGAVQGHPARDHEHLDDDQRDGAVAPRPLHRRRRRAGRAAQGAARARRRTTSSRNICPAAPTCFRRRRPCG